MIPLPRFTADVWTLLAPVLVVFGTACSILILDLFAGKRRVPWNLISLAGLAVAAFLVIGRWGNPLPAAETYLSGALRVDDLAVFLEVAILIAAALCLLPADSYLRWAGRGQEAEFHALALFSVTGMLLLVSSGELITLFLGLELLSFPTYALCAFRRDDVHSNEAALKYFVLGSFASSIFLYGVALCWGATGTTLVASFGEASETALLHFGLLLLLVGFLFKIGAAPFHMWVPDVYEGAPTPVTAFMATGVKVAAFGAFLRVLFGAMVTETLPLAPIFWWLACITMIVGNLSALTQDNIKRMLAFSSVAHAGYMLVGLTAVVVSGWDTGAAAVLFYLVAYVFMNVGAFTVLLLLSRHAEGELNFDRDWSGAARRHPFLGAAMVVFMMGLGGIPPTAGFFGKYSVFKAAMDTGLTSLVIVAVLNSLVSVYYYLRVIVALYMRSERQSVPAVLESLGSGPRAHPLEGPGAMAAAEATAPQVPRLAARGAWMAKLVVAVCLFATLWLGLGPNLGGFPGVSRVIEWAATAAATLR